MRAQTTRRFASASLAPGVAEEAKANCHSKEHPKHTGDNFLNTCYEPKTNRKPSRHFLVLIAINNWFKRIAAEI
jgi:hypothetical protein